MLLVFYAERFSDTMTICGGGIGLFVTDKNNREPRTLTIYFYQDKIYYWFNEAMHHYVHAPIVKYIYHLMSLMDTVSWMKVVLSYIYTNVVKSLESMCMMKCPLHQHESTFKRYLTPVHTVFRAFSTINMLPLTSNRHVQDF